jgi:uncharacterized protein (DUF2384 family)
VKKTEAEQVFGDSERAERWLRKERRSFDGKTPLEMAASQDGARRVEEVLMRIDHGMLA